MSNLKACLLAEWEPLDAVILAWPHAHTDWAPWLEDTRQTYLSLIEQINDADAGVILLCLQEDIATLTPRLSPDARVLIVPAQYNDTWARDFAFLTCKSPTHPHRQPVEFTFNGWGGKFDAQQDNQVNQRYLAELCALPLRTIEMVAEGGALEIDDQGHLLTTAQCLLNPGRNKTMPLHVSVDTLKNALGCQQATVFQHGHLEGDDTDGHIDTLVRFTPDGGLVIQGADNRPDDSHYASLSALCEECAAYLPDHKQFRLPLPHIDNDAGERLPASYANFLICNQRVLFPVYGVNEDKEAIRVITDAFPSHTIVAVNCATLIRQFGSLHCISMQIPQHTLRPEVLSQLNKGVTTYVS
ncbi:agmatine deiminase family protein [Alteromonas sp. C1M14]|uniref:agmatine deiminase family protein n=1 Tax=Alteromonas sp. C1M14 TaxID=2841567 RepID=UPI001C091413|nr:agmatine deiminase family protein [Alteromonas sp. C1M14]MBU2980151.1 agmatine deiminase family protein [Alteromonas sp. C1M14]